MSKRLKCSALRKISCKHLQSQTAAAVIFCLHGTGWLELMLQPVQGDIRCPIFNARECLEGPTCKGVSNTLRLPRLEIKIDSKLIWSVFVTKQIPTIISKSHRTPIQLNEKKSFWNERRFSVRSGRISGHSEGCHDTKHWVLLSRKHAGFLPRSGSLRFQTHPLASGPCIWLWGNVISFGWSSLGTSLGAWNVSSYLLRPCLQSTHFKLPGSPTDLCRCLPWFLATLHFGAIQAASNTKTMR